MTQFNTIQDDKPKTTTRDRKVLQDTRIDNFEDLMDPEKELVAETPQKKSSEKNNSNNRGNEYKIPEIEKFSSKQKGTSSPAGGKTSAQLTQNSKDYIRTIKTPQETKSFLKKATNILRLDQHTPAYFVDALPIVVNAPYNINTPERLANFMGQCMAESGLFPKSEAMGYNAQNIFDTFKKSIGGSRRRANELASKDPSKLGGWADVIYGAKLGNTVGKISPALDGNKGTPEGYTYRGHGLIQSTGKSKYRRFDEKFAGYDESGASKVKSLTGLDDVRPIVKGSDPKNDPPGSKPRMVEEGHFTIFPDITSNPKDPIWAVITSLEYFRNNKKLLVNNVSPTTSKLLTTLVRGTPSGYQLRHKWASYFFDKLK